MAIDLMSGIATGSGNTWIILLMAFWVMIVVFILLTCLLVIIYFLFLNVSITIIERIGDKMFKISTDRGRRMKKRGEDGIRMLKLFWAKKELPGIDDRHYGLKRRTKALILYKCGDDYTPVNLNFIDEVIQREEVEEYIDENGEKTKRMVKKSCVVDLQTELQWRMNWLSERKRQSIKFDPRDFWDKYGGAITVIGTLIMVFVILVVTFKQQGEIVSQSNAAAKSLELAMNRLVDLINSGQL